MAKQCEVCDRGASRGNTRSHSNIATKKRRQLNLQSAVIDGKKVKACTSCIRTHAKKMEHAS